MFVINVGQAKQTLLGKSKYQMWLPQVGGG